MWNGRRGQCSVAGHFFCVYSPDDQIQAKFGRSARSRDNRAGEVETLSSVRGLYGEICIARSSHWQKAETRRLYRTKRGLHMGLRLVIHGGCRMCLGEGGSPFGVKIWILQYLLKIDSLSHLFCFMIWMIVLLVSRHRENIYQKSI